jgi:hypothetical protein
MVKKFGSFEYSIENGHITVYDCPKDEVVNKYFGEYRLNRDYTDKEVDDLIMAVVMSVPDPDDLELMESMLVEV